MVKIAFRFFIPVSHQPIPPFQEHCRHYNRGNNCSDMSSKAHPRFHSFHFQNFGFDFIQKIELVFPLKGDGENGGNFAAAVSA